jgi:hypothetical protein
VRPARALLVLLAALVCGTIAAHAQTPAPGVQYVAFLHDALDAMPPGDTAPAGDPALDRVRAPLRAARDLSPGPAAIDPILGDLARDPANLRQARADLQTLIAAVSLPSGSVAEDPHAATGALHDVYGQSQFNGLGQRPASNDLFSRIGRALLEFFGWLFSHTLAHLGLIPSILVAALVIGAILAFVLLRLQRAGSRVPWRATVAQPAAGGTDPDAEWRLATEAAARGNYREAVRHAFRSALLSVAVAGRLPVDAAWTTSELLARARGDADLVAALAPAADSFDRAWYSGRPVSRHDWEVGRDRCLAVRELAGRRRVPS